MAWAGNGLSSVFTNDAAIAEKALWAIRVYTLSLLPLGIQYEIVDGFTAIGKVQYSLPLSFWRKLVYFAALFLLPAIWGAESAIFCGAYFRCCRPSCFDNGLFIRDEKGSG